MRPAAYFFLCTSVFDIEYLAAIYHFFFWEGALGCPTVHVFRFKIPLKQCALH